MANSCAFCLPENVFSLVSFLKVLFPEDRLYGGLLFPYSTLNTLFHGLLESIGADENVVVSLTVAYLKIICPFNVVLKPPPPFFLVFCNYVELENLPVLSLVSVQSFQFL